MEIDFFARSADLDDWCAIGAPLGLGGEFDTERRHRDRRGSWHPARGLLHDRVLDSFSEDLWPESTGTAILLAGLPGAGKTSLRKKLSADHRLVPHTAVDTDEIREQLIHRLFTEDRLPVDLEEWRPGNLGLTPLELSSSCHREAKHLEARRVDAIGSLGAPNVLIDTTLSSEEVGRTWVRRLRDMGYGHVECRLVEASRSEAQRRCATRWERDVRRYFSGVGLGGRYIPPSNFDGYFSDGALRATCVEAYERLRDLGAPHGFDAAFRYRAIERNGVPDFEAVQ